MRNLWTLSALAIMMVCGVAYCLDPPKIDSVSPPSLSHLKELKELDVAVSSDPEGSVEALAVYFSVNGAPVANVPAAEKQSPERFKLSPAENREGVYVFRLTAVDAQGQKSEPFDVTYYIDRTPPKVEWWSPAQEKRYFNELKAIRFGLSEPEKVSRIKTEVTLLFNQKPLPEVKPAWSDPATCTVIVPPATEGEFTLSVFPADKAGNVGPELAQVYHVDIVPPTATITQLDKDRFVLVTILDNAMPDSRNSLVTVYQKNQPVPVPQQIQDEGRVQLSFAEMPAGLYMVAVQPRDAAGNSTNLVTREITVPAAP